MKSDKISLLQLYHKLMNFGIVYQNIVILFCSVTIDVKQNKKKKSKFLYNEVTTNQKRNLLL